MIEENDDKEWGIVVVLPGEGKGEDIHWIAGGTGRNGRFTCLYEKNKDHLKNQKIFNFTIKDSYIT